MDLDLEPFHAKLFACSPIYDSVFACLSPRSLVRVTLTCHAAHAAVTSFKIRAYNINRHFSRFFPDPLAFRSLQARTNSLVAGSCALQFLDRTFYPESDFDLYTHPGHSFEVAQFLVDTGYHYVPRATQKKEWKDAIPSEWDGTEQRVFTERGVDHAYPEREISEVWSFEKSVDQGRLTVQIIQALASPFESILGFHSTCVMNFISSDAAYSLFPGATFEHRTSLGMPSSWSSRSSRKAVQKYTERGWRILYTPLARDLTPFFVGHTRWVRDKYTWRMPLDQTGVDARPPLSPTSTALTFDPVSLHGWTMKTYRRRDDGITRYECHYYPLQTTLCRYNYAIPDETMVLRIRHWARDKGVYCHKHVAKANWAWYDEDVAGFINS